MIKLFKRLTFVHWSRPEAESGRIRVFALLTGLMWAVMVTLFCGVILALWVTLSPNPRYHLSGILGICMLAGALLGGGVGGFTARRQGWLHGGTVGLVYGILFLLMLAGGDRNALLNPAMLLRLPVLMLGGALGGIVGVNLPYGRVRAVRRMGR